MTLPNGSAGLATIGLEFAFTNDGSIPGAVDRTRDAIEGVLKADILASPGWGGAHEVAYDGLPAGVPLFLGQIMRMAQELTGLPIEDWGTPVLGMIDDVFGVIGTFSSRLTSLFGSLNFLQEGGWNPVEMIGEWLENDILPLGFIAELIDGFIPDLNIPGLDASKIISGSFPMEMINGLLDILDDVPVLGTVLGWFGLDPDGDESDLQGLLGSFLSENSPLNALNLFNLPGILGSLNIGALTNEAREELIAPTMDYVENIVGGNTWLWDGVDGRTSPGCVTTTGAGVERVLKSNAIAVAPGQTFNIHVYAKWSGLTYASTNPIQLRVRRFLNYVVQGVDMIGAIASPGASGGWTQMVDTDYEVPTGCDMIVVEFYVSDMVTAGTVKFDDASAKRTGMIQIPWVSGLSSQLENLVNWIESLVDNLLGALGMGTGGSIVDKIGDVFEGFFPRMQNIGEDGILDVLGIPELPDIKIPGIGSILDNLFGGINRTNSTGHTHTEVRESVQSQNEAIVGNASDVAQIRAALAGGNTDADDFNRTSLGTAWRTIFSSGGSASISNGQLVMSHDDNTDFLLLRTSTQAATLFQTAEIVLGSAPGWNTVLVDTARGHNDIWLRCSNFTTWATRTGVRLRWTAQNNNIRLSAFVNGSEVVVMFDQEVANATGGSKLRLECGVNGVLRRFGIRVNGSLVENGDVIESGTASPATNGTHMWRGLGGRTEHLGIFPFEVSPDPGRVDVWTATG